MGIKSSINLVIWPHVTQFNRILTTRVISGHISRHLIISVGSRYIFYLDLKGISFASHLVQVAGQVMCVRVRFCKLVDGNVRLRITYKGEIILQDSAILARKRDIRAWQ